MLKKLKEDISIYKIVFLYRYTVLIITSFFYMIGCEHFSQAIGVICGMVLIAVIGHYLYVQSKESKKARMIVLGLEAVGSVGILALSGGANSPYIWYIINTVFILSLEKAFKWAWLSLVGYMASIFISQYYLPLSLIQYKQEYTSSLNVMLGAVLVTATVQFIIHYEKKLEERNVELVRANQELAEAKQKVKKSLDYVMESYQPIHLFCMENNKETLIKMMLDYINYVVGIKRVLFIDFTNEDRAYDVYARNFMEVEENKLSRLVLNKPGELDKERYFQVLESSFLSQPVAYLHELFGLLVVETDKMLEEVEFIIELSSVLFKKIDLKKLNEKFIINEEQNRIANEIHDSSLQTLVGISYQLFNLAKKTQVQKDEELMAQLNEVRGHITETMGNLRKIIYGMSWSKDSSCCLEAKLRECIEQMTSFYGNQVTLKVEGELQILATRQKEAIYRIVCEGISNGCRHGKASQIKVELQVSESKVYLSIRDNGNGFDYTRLENDQQVGVGLKNIQYLVNSLQGQFKIQSLLNCGTQLIIELPTVRHQDMDFKGVNNDEYAHCR